MSDVRLLVALTGAAILLLSACARNGSESESPSSSAGPAWSQGSVPTAEQLASVLVTADDYDGRWTVNVPPDAQMATPGVVPETQQQMLPKVELCDKASEKSRSALTWPPAIGWAT